MRRQPLALNAPTSDRIMVMPVDSPFNPYGSRFFDPAGAPNPDGSPRLTGTPRTVGFTQLTVADLAAETVETEADALRVVGGLRGAFGIRHGRGRRRCSTTKSTAKTMRSRTCAKACCRPPSDAWTPVLSILSVTRSGWPTARSLADQPYTNPASVLDSFSDVFARSARSYIASGDFRATGELFTLRGGDALAAVGAEYRREDLLDIRPPFSGENPAASGLDPTNNDFLLHPPRPDVFGDRDVTSVYAEMILPLVSADRPLPAVNSFEVTLSARFEDYSDFGGTTKPKVGANWRPCRG